MPPSIPVATRNRCWLDVIAAMARLLRCVRPTPAPMPPPLSLLCACATPSSVDSTTTWDSLDCSQASVSSALWALHLQPQGCCPHPTFSVAVTRRLACLVLWTRSVMMGSSLLAYMSHPLFDILFMLRPPRLQIVTIKFPFCVFHPALPCFHVIVMMRFLLWALCFLVHPTVLLW
jgi:hypothetical protein